MYLHSIKGHWHVCRILLDYIFIWFECLYTAFQQQESSESNLFSKIRVGECLLVPKELTILGNSDQLTFSCLGPFPGYVWDADSKNGLTFPLSHLVTEIWHNLVSKWFKQFPYGASTAAAHLSICDLVWLLSAHPSSNGYGAHGTHTPWHLYGHLILSANKGMRHVIHSKFVLNGISDGPASERETPRWVCPSPPIPTGLSRQCKLSSRQPNNIPVRPGCISLFTACQGICDGTGAWLEQVGLGPCWLELVWTPLLLQPCPVIAFFDSSITLLAHIQLVVH